MNFDFKTYWDTDSNSIVEGTLLVNALVATGKYTEANAISLVTKFHNDAFDDGASDEAFNNCGEAA